MIVENLINLLVSIKEGEIEDYTVVIPFGGKPKRINFRNEYFGTITHECESKIVLENNNLEIIMKVKP